MFRYALLILFALPFVVNAEHQIKDGPCLTPTPIVGDYNETELGIVWYEIGTNCEVLSNRECVEAKVVAIEGDGMITNLHYRDSDSNDHLVIRKYKAAADQPGRFQSYKKTTDGTYEPTGWTYTIVKLHGNAILQYICKQDADGAHHEDNYRLFAKTVDVDEETLNVMKEFYEATGDGRPTYRYKHENCEYKLESSVININK